MSRVFDETICMLGEGPLWHPVRGEFLWFDILNRRLHRREADKLHTAQFDEYVSAAGWVDESRLLVASASKLFVYDLDRGTSEDVAPLEADNAVTRSNDGRADPFGGFWIGTMGINAEKGAGSIYRYYRGEVRKLFGDITVSNAICFSPDCKFAYYADTDTSLIMRQPLESEHGWPDGSAEICVDLTAEGLRPDGAVVDADGNIWNAQWGAWRVACYAPDGSFRHAVDFDAANTSCPAFGGPDLTTLYCTTALQKLSGDVLAKSSNHGKTFVQDDVAKGQAEHQVIL